MTEKKLTILVLLKNHYQGLKNETNDYRRMTKNNCLAKRLRGNN